MSAYMGVISLAAVVMAAALDVAANLLLVKSRGFRLLGYGFGSLLLVCMAFTCLAFAVREIDLAVAYAMWGGFGILGTSIGGWLMLGQRLRPTAWLGIAILISGISILHLA